MSVVSLAQSHDHERCKLQNSISFNLYGIYEILQLYEMQFGSRQSSFQTNDNK